MNFALRVLSICCLSFACALPACGGSDAAESDDDTSGQDDGDSTGSKADARVATSKDAGPSAASDASKPSADSGSALPETAADAGGSANPDTSLPTGSTFPSVKDPTAAGPYKTKTVSNAGPNSNYTIFQPDPLGAEGVKHPVLTWGNGGGTTPALYGMLPHLASHGFVVVAANTVPQIGAEEALGKDMLTGIDWILEQNTTQDSAYFGKLDSARVAPFGYSMGGLATFTIVSDPRWVTTVHLSGGNMGNGGERIANAHAPMFWECGDGDIAGPNCDTDFTTITTQSVFYGSLLKSDHLTIITNDTKIRSAVTSWFRYYLMGDQSFKSSFVGADCTLCKDTATWKVQKKNFD